MKQSPSNLDLLVNLCELKFQIINLKLCRVNKTIEYKYDLLLDKIEQKTNLDNSASKLNEHREKLLQESDIGLERTIRSLEISFDYKKHLLYFFQSTNDSDIETNLNSIVIMEGIFGKFKQKRYNLNDMERLSAHANLNTVNIEFIVKRKFNLKVMDFYFMENDIFLVRTIDKSQKNSLKIIDKNGKLYYSKDYSQLNATNSLFLALKQTKNIIYTLYRIDNIVYIDKLDLRLNQLGGFQLSIQKFLIKDHDVSIWNFLVYKNELILSLRVDYCSSFDLFYLVYSMKEQFKLVKVIKHKETKFENNFRQECLINKRDACLIYFTKDYFYFLINDTSQKFEYFLDIVPRAELSHSTPIKQIQLCDSSDFFFDSKSNQFMTILSAGKNKLRFNGRNFYHELYDENGLKLYRDDNKTRMFNAAELTSFKSYFKNIYSLSMFNLFKDYFSSKYF
jgi:hypothetical protein